MRFLLTNDDGVSAPGLAALEAAARNFGDCLVVAPESQLSGCSHQATCGAPLTLTELGPARYMLNGTPADCVRVALAHLRHPVDFVLSGVNAGGNLGADVYLSGTVAAVREAALLGKPGVSLSQYRRGREFNWRRVTDWTEIILQRLLENRPASASFWNVNFPELDDEEAFPEVVFCPLDPHPLPVMFREEGGQLHYTGDYHGRTRMDGRDVDTCFSGRIAVTEIRCSL